MDEAGLGVYACAFKLLSAINLVITAQSYLQLVEKFKGRKFITPKANLIKDQQKVISVDSRPPVKSLHEFAEWACGFGVGPCNTTNFSEKRLRPPEISRKQVSNLNA